MGSQPSWPPFQPSQDCTQGICSVYCPQWCYFLFPPPPSLDTDSDPGPTISPLGIALIALAAAAFILVGYYTIVYRHCRRVRHHPTTPPTTSTDTTAPADLPPDGLDEALINKITVHRYRRGDGLVGGTNCSVCLTEFRDDDNLRLLPRCSHAFHVPCIDKWLKSHPNCPLCRAGIVWGGPPARVAPAAMPPVPQVAIEMRESGTSLVGAGEESAKHGGQREIQDVIEVSRSFESTASSAGVSSTGRR